MSKTASVEASPPEQPIGELTDARLALLTVLSIGSIVWHQVQRKKLDKAEVSEDLAALLDEIKGRLFPDPEGVAGD